MKKRYESKTYLHFDKKTSFNPKVENYVKDFEKNPSHSFLPLIFDERVSERYIGYNEDISKNYVREGKITPIKLKKRKIMYASHIDNFIYKHYALELNRLYNDYLVNNDFENVSLAYRHGSELFRGKCNIHFSAEVINYIKNNPNSIVYVGDFSDFFDTLKHDYLKLMINKLYSGMRMPKHQFKIFNSLTKFSYINKVDIEEHLGTDEEMYALKKRQYVDSFEEFREFKNKETINGRILKTNDEDFGIPQGTAISALYSNIYMLEIDMIINKIVHEKNGIYRRYSDDYIIVIPNQSAIEFEEFKQNLELIMKKDAHLTIHEDKTQTMRFIDNKLVDFCDSTKLVKLDYLGFTFNGNEVYMREKSVHKYYSSVNNLLRKGYIVSKNKNHNRLTYKRKMYQRYHIFGERTDFKYGYPTREYGTFITYAHKCQRIFDELSPNTNNKMKTQIKYHQKNIENKMNYYKKKLQSR
ncbi:reverse transcriptase domain-containing protein [Vagococcus fluvialis]|uniref:reverse transcriptase domain-containing protein n=1 Tax=Vagococcus fluvialis TaxID=2738 RepID=UPI003B5C8279